MLRFFKHIFTAINPNGIDCMPIIADKGFDTQSINFIGWQQPSFSPNDEMRHNIPIQKRGFWQRLVKRTLDITACSLALLALSPLFVTIALLIKFTSKGPIFHNQIRVGRGGVFFTMYKFRSMVKDAEKIQKDLQAYNELDGPVFKIKNDPRVTPIGHFIRRYSIDELPQLLNIIKGDMSIVGPRPPIPCEVLKYETWQLRRLSVAGGLTCIWQISGRNNINFKRWMEMDLEYIDQWSIWLDIKIIFKTFRAVFFPKGAY